MRRIFWTLGWTMCAALGCNVVASCSKVACEDNGTCPATENEDAGSVADVPVASEDAPAGDDAPSTPDTSAPEDVTDAPRVDADRVDSAPPGCATPADCRLYTSTCGSCSCIPLAKTAPDPTCTKPTALCLTDSCAGRRPTCDTATGTCGMQ